MDGKSVEDCLSQRIDLIDEIINNREDLSVLVNKAREEGNILTLGQGIVIIQNWNKNNKKLPGNDEDAMRRCLG